MKLDLNLIGKLLAMNGARRDRSMNQRDAIHAVNPAGTKIAKAFERRVWSGRVRMPA